MEPIEVTIIGEKPRVLPVTVEVSPDGDLRPYRLQKLVQFYSEQGTRTVALANLSFR